MRSRSNGVRFGQAAAAEMRAARTAVSMARFLTTHRAPRPQQQVVEQDEYDAALEWAASETSPSPWRMNDDE